MSNSIVNGRIAYLDICKALAIFLVVWGHVIVVYDSEAYSGSIAKGIYSMHCPFFMFLSGLFLSRSLKKDFKSLLKEKSRQFLLPYFAWSFITMVLILIPENGISHAGETIKSFLMGGVFRFYWYLKLLFVYIITTWLLVKLLHNEIVGCLASLCLFMALPDFSFSSVMIPFFIVGHLTWPWLKKLQSWAWLIPSFIMCVLVYLLWDPSYNYTNVKLTSWPILVRTGVGCFVSVFLILLLKHMEKYIPSSFVKFLTVLGVSTLGIYCGSDVVYRGYPGQLIRLLPENDVIYFLVAIVVTVITLLLVRAIERNKYLSFVLLGKKFK